MLRPASDSAPHFGILRLCIVVGLAMAMASSLPAAPLDLEDPGDAVKAMRKLQCHLEDDKPAFYTWTGKVYSRIPGERDRLLFTYEGMNVRACKTVEGTAEQGYGYRMVSREVLIYQDPQTGEVLRTWKNPWTGEDVEVIHIANDPVNSRGPLFAHGSRGPFQFAATIQDGRGWMGFEVPLFYTNPLGGDYQEYVGGTYQAIEMFNFFFDAEALVDENVGGLDDAHVGWARVSQWLPWMRMGSRVGQMMFNGAGKRVRTFDDLPELLRREITEHHPDYKMPPSTDDTRRNETSWTYFKKLIDEQRAADGDKASSRQGH